MKFCYKGFRDHVLIRILCGCWSILLLSSLRLAGDGYTEGEKLFALKVKPLLEQKCFSCHGGKDKIKGDLILTNREDLLLGGETSDEVLIPGNGNDSLMYISTTRTLEDYEMPPKEADKLTEEQSWLIRDWIDAGAPWPSDENQMIIAEKYAEGVRVQTSGGQDNDWTNRRYEEKNLWAYQAISDPEIPGNSNRIHPIDAFVNRKLDEIGLEPASLADRRTLIRRATFDLLGLPPTPQEVRAFVEDPSSEEKAFAKVVDRLLEDPRYGEQWGRHWLDVVRYADSAGFANDYERTNAWRYRDYIIRSFNQDKPFDEFIMEQVAGDEWDPGNPEAIIATGFLRMGPWENTSMTVARITRQQFLDDVTDSVGQVFMSHPLQCARCHDHKFDPIPTKDYYRIQAVFATTQFADRELPFHEDEALIGFDEKEAMQKRIDYFDEIRDELTAKATEAEKQWCLENGIPVGKRAQLAKQGIPVDQLPPRDIGLTFEETGVRKVALKNVLRSTYELNRFEPYALSVYSGKSPEKPLISGSMVSMPEDPMGKGELEASHIMVGGDPFARGEVVTPGVLSALPNSDNPSEETKIPETPQGRRLAFAKWLTRPENTLVPRSMVNRIWNYHFNQGIVDTPNNFGAMGGKPSHPELLDFLASRFIESRWSIKEMHRLIMASETYRRSTEHKRREELVEKDPNGKLYATFKHRRLSAEEIRDSMLFVSGELSSHFGGLPARPEINMDVALQPRQIMGSFAASYEPARTPELRNRRSVYAKKIRGLRNPFMEVFNQPSPDESCEFRDSSTVTPQVFSLFNGEDSLLRSIATSIDLLEKHDSRKAIIEDLFSRAYGRKPSQDEIQICLNHWKDQERQHETLTFEPRSFPKEVERSAVEEMTGVPFSFTEALFGFDNYVADPGLADVDAETRALAHLCLVVFNSNEFLNVY
ncbi:PSD1 and planctomycete cytochrome C domain-containing protein [Opitutaceae bacterium]|nr:PSD1 and planctomycete cytochrome C domain-containing protein [Opitutaceae bacterium]